MFFARLSFALIGMAIAVPVAQGRELDDRQKGRILARQICGECHAVRAREPGSPSAQAPSFAAIAATRGMTARALNAFLNTSHRTMPNIMLTADQTQEIVAYILSFRK